MSLNIEGRHPGLARWKDAFEGGHLPKGLPRDVMAGYRSLAVSLLDLLPDGPQLTDALHELWRSKNEAVLHAVETQRARDAARSED